MIFLTKKSCKHLEINKLYCKFVTKYKQMKHFDFIKENGEVIDIGSVKSWLDRAIKYITNGRYSLTITRQVKRRSLEQNRLMWMWFKCMEDSTGQPSVDWHDYYCLKLLGRDFVTPDGEIIEIAGHTSVLNTAKMTDFLNKVQADAATEFGISLPSPDDIGYDDFRLQYERYV